MRDRSKQAVAFVAALMLLSACSSKAQEATRVAQAPQSTTTPTPDPTCPLTGEDPGTVDLSRPAVALKIENSPQARPQSGIAEADLVFEEIVEGGITRFMAIYHCGDSDRAGPVRSARFDDPKIAAPFTRLIAFSGANDIVAAELEKRGVVAIEEDNAESTLFRDPPGVLEVHNLFGNTELIRELDAARRLGAPETALRFAELPATAEDAKRIKLSFTSSNPIEYRWKGGAWKRWEDGERFLTSDGTQIAPANVLVQEVRVDNSTSIFDIAGNPSPDIKLEGLGRAWLFRDGKVIEGTWTADRNGVPEFVTLEGDEFTFAIGTTWIELVPSDEGSVKGKFRFK